MTEDNKNTEKQCDIQVASKSKTDKREEAYKKYFRDHSNFIGKSIRYRGDYLFNKDEAYDCIDYYLQTGIEP